MLTDDDVIEGWKGHIAPALHKQLDAVPSAQICLHIFSEGESTLNAAHPHHHSEADCCQVFSVL